MSFDVEGVRQQFPYLDQRVYLNTASTGISRRDAGQAAGRFFDEMYSKGFDGRDLWRSVIADVRDQVGRMAHVPAETVGFAGSTTEALNRLALALPVSPGDRVVLCDDEFPSVQAVARLLVARGATLVPVAVPEEAMRTEALAAAARDSRIVLASHVHWETGTKLDLAVLSRVSRDAGAFLIVDGIQALGATPVEAGLADAYVGAVFKWLISGFGLAVSIVAPRLAEELIPVMRGYANPEPSRELGYSHVNYPGLVTLRDSLAYLERIGWNVVYERNAVLRAHLRASLRDIGVELVTPDAAAAITSVACADPQGTAERLAARGVSVEPRGRFLRVSPHFYNTAADIDRFSEILRDLQKEQS
ncbi:aminotransferase class V-fold PLP-dependent enzyme [Aquamicrobium sp. LC103]|uniref:aminotransferase class V-fold PLP-dependent enzyme n=1 Tax=Aquamicrobium sp. LC103 TaxID=1120658 RepID=UPI00063EC8E2|nr:aminotransferase class V-fold PLP-dependent enzyme [Aquamicrobium sp. LC103]TKT81032.1 aminotransferase class V-fold PLP-dependent enzyme [Aquamicrobium sp. LC103]